MKNSLEELIATLQGFAAAGATDVVLRQWDVDYRIGLADIDGNLVYMIPELLEVQKKRIASDRFHG